MVCYGNNVSESGDRQTKAVIDENSMSLPPPPSPLHNTENTPVARSFIPVTQEILVIILQMLQDPLEKFMFF